MNKNLMTKLLLSGGPISLTFLLSPGVVPPAVAQANGEAVPVSPTGQTGVQPPSQPAAGADNQAATADPTPPASTGFWDRSNLFGDMGGLRPWIGDDDVTIGLQETSEYLNNLSASTRRGGAYDGLT